jgi:hypothetical protein
MLFVLSNAETSLLGMLTPLLVLEQIHELREGLPVHSLRQQFLSTSKASTALRPVDW